MRSRVVPIPLCSFHVPWDASAWKDSALTTTSSRALYWFSFPQWARFKKYTHFSGICRGGFGTTSRQHYW
eukprot:scaffold7963_cov131-Cylindrotheca_fusiformis.AAC.1